VGRFTLKVTPTDASLTVDAKPAEREPDGSLLLPFGRHVVAATCTGCTPAERAVDVRGGERLEIALAPGAAAGAPDASLRKADAAQTPTAGAEPATATYALGAVALAAAAGAVGAGLWWHGRTSELDLCHAAGARCLNEATVSREDRIAAITTVGLGAVALTAGVVAAALWGRREHEPAAVRSVACVPIGEGVACALRF